MNKIKHQVLLAVTGCLFLLVLLMMQCHEPNRVVPELYEIKNGQIEILGDSAYVTFRLINHSKRDSIFRLDLWNNEENQERNVYIFAQDCFILPQDSSEVHFRIHYDVDSITPNFFIKTNQIVARLSSHQKYYRGDSDHPFLFKLSAEAFVEKQAEQKERNSFKFLGEGLNRPENFHDYPGEVTEENIEHLYREYDVFKVPSTDIYHISSKRIYRSARFFTRLLKFRSGHQVADITYYDSYIPYVFVQGDKYLIGINPLLTGSSSGSSYTCKTVLLDSTLKPINERIFKYKEQRDAYYAYTSFQSLTPNQRGYDFTVVNKGFDSEDYFEYKGTLSFGNQVVRSSKRHIFLNE